MTALIFGANGMGVAFSIQEWMRHLVSGPATIRSLGWQPMVDLPELAAMMVHAKLEDRASIQAEMAAAFPVPAGVYHHA